LRGHIDEAWNNLPDWLKEDSSVPKLSRLSARVIRCHKIPYSHKLPPSLCRFVEIHARDGQLVLQYLLALMEKLNWNLMF